MNKDNFGFASPSECGVPYESINAFIDELEARGIMMHGFALLRHDKIFAEGYFAPVDDKFLHRMYSTSKSFASMALGILIGEGKVKFEDKIADLILTGSIGEGSTVYIDVKGKDLTVG